MCIPDNYLITWGVTCYSPEKPPPHSLFLLFLSFDGMMAFFLGVCLNDTNLLIKLLTPGGL